MNLRELTIPAPSAPTPGAPPVGGDPAPTAPTSARGIASTATPTQPRLTIAVRWAVTVAATGVSTWALDLIATAAGVLLVASRALDGAPRSLVLGFLGTSYVLWAAGLRINLITNWRLLEETGTSTNALSKLLFDLVRVRTRRARALRTASATGYVVTEIAKEAPYYAGAFGAAVLSDTVDSTDALVFLGGTNIGAAVYEYGVARLSCIFLDRRSREGGPHPPPSQPTPYRDSAPIDGLA